MRDRIEAGGRSKVWSPPKEDRRCKMQKVGAKFPAIKNFSVPDQDGDPLAADLFGLPPEIVHVVVARCGECGSDFDQGPPRGRPRRFCSDPCRTASKRRQMREWNNRNLVPAALLCRQCGTQFDPPPRTAGRLPHFCGPACKRASFRPTAPPRGPDLLDQLPKSKPKGIPT